MQKQVSMFEQNGFPTSVSSHVSWEHNSFFSLPHKGFETSPQIRPPHKQYTSHHPSLNIFERSNAGAILDTPLVAISPEGTFPILQQTYLNPLATDHTKQLQASA
jgi:hypothetical protein